MEEAIINSKLSANEKTIKNKIGESFDIKYRNFTLPAFKNTEALIVYLSGLVDTRMIDETIIEPLLKFSTENIKNNGRLISSLADYGVFTSAVKISVNMDEICDAILSGDTVLFADYCNSALILSTRKYDFRAVTEPTIENEIKGPRDGFVENIQTNAALIRRRIKDHGLRFENMQLGERTKTTVSLVYINSLVNESLLEEIRSRLGRINTDSILGSGYIEEFIQDNPLSLFPQVASTERPDRASAAILEGRIVIIVDNTPIVIIIPTVFWQFLLSGSDYYDKFLLSTFLRCIRVFALFLSISLSSLYVLLTSFHQEMLPTVLALKIAEGRSGVPFPAVIEALLMEVILEIMKEAGLRMPKAIGQTVNIVGTLVIGQAAVSAGLVSPLMVIVIAIAAVSSFAIPSYAMSNALRLLRFPLLFLSATFGLLGYLGGLIALNLNLMSLRSFGTPYLAPLIPYDKSSFRDIFIRSPWWNMTKRPPLARPKDVTRQSPGLKPQPPSDKKSSSGKKR